MRSSPRLSFFAAFCTVAMLTLPTFARTYEYTLTSAPAGWTFSVSGNTKFTGNGYCFANADAEMQTAEFDGPITNLVFSGYRTSSCNRQIRFTAGNVVETWQTGTLVGTSLSEFKVVQLDAEDNITSFNLKSAGGSQNFYLKTVTVYIADPPPTIDTITDLQASTASDLVVHFTATSFGGDDPLAFSATAENLDSPGTTITDQSYFQFAPNYTHPGGYDFTFYPPDGFGPCRMRFTITATGIGGSASQSFVCTFIEGAVPTPPQVWTPTYNPAGVLAGRPITLQVPYEEADGDQVTFTVTNATPCNGPYSIGASTGIFTFTPTLLDVSEYHEFTARATDKDGYNETSIRVVVFPAGPPKLAPIDDYTMAFGETLSIVLEAEATEYNSIQGDIEDPLISSNITIKAGTTAPEGEYLFEDGCLSFTPNTNDVGKTFIFTASATDFDGTTNVDFSVTIGLEKPVLKHCPVDQWTATSFTADIQAAIPGATSYTLRYVHYEDNGTVVTGYVNDATFPCVVENLSATNYVYDVQAKRGAITSAWSNAKSIDLHKYIAPTYAIPMTGAAHGAYHQTFDGLISSGSAYWYDARTIAGWYAANSSGSMSDVKYSANDGGSSGTGLFSCQVDFEGGPVTNRALGAHADTQYDDLSFGVMFTNQCKYAVTNITVSFKAMQFRRYQPISHLYFSYTRSNRLIDYNDPENSWTDVDALEFAAPTQGSSSELRPPTAVPKAADIPFEGENAIQPGEVIAMRWYLYAKSNWPTLGIDDLEVSWECAWPRHTVIILQ